MSVSSELPSSVEKDTEVRGGSDATWGGAESLNRQAQSDRLALAAHMSRWDQAAMRRSIP